jgi:RNA polymerase sigma-70 factor (ECF subfamily)
LNGLIININSEDSDIIESFNKGNKSAFNYLVLKYQKKIYWVIRKIVLDHDEADDITQEVFLKIYDSLKNFRGDSKFFTYIYKIAVNYSINYLNKNKRILSKKADYDTEAFKITSNEMKPDELHDSIQRTKLLEQAIFSLPPQQRAVFNMRFYDNLTYDEIGAILNKSTGGLKANYFHATKKIEEYLKKKVIFKE